MTKEGNLKATTMLIRDFGIQAFLTILISFLLNGGISGYSQAGDLELSKGINSKVDHLFGVSVAKPALLKKGHYANSVRRSPGTLPVFKRPLSDLIEVNRNDLTYRKVIDATRLVSNQFKDN